MQTALGAASASLLGNLGVLALRLTIFIRQLNGTKKIVCILLQYQQVWVPGYRIKLLIEVSVYHDRLRIQFVTTPFSIVVVVKTG